MAYITKIDLAKQAKLKSGDTASLDGSLKIGEGVEIKGDLYYKRFDSLTGQNTYLLKLNTDGRITPVLVSDLGIGNGGNGGNNGNTALKYRGVWGDPTLLPYTLGDMVSHEGDLYVLTVGTLTTNTEPNPSMTTPWTLIASAGYKGNDGVSYEIIFKLTNSLTTPATPVATDRDRKKDDDFPSDWSDDIMSPTSNNQYVFVSKRKKGADGIWGLYQEPTLWGRYVTNGVDGVDGNTFQYIFRLFDKELSESEIIANQPTQSEQSDNFVPVGWFDNQQGVSNTLKYEYVSMRIKSNGTWSGYNKPALYAKYSADGVDGKDGASIEFIFYNTNDLEDPIVKEAPLGDRNVDESFQSPWTDDPKGVSETKQFEFYSKRTKAAGSTQWSLYTLPSLWSTFAFDGKDGKDGKGIEFIFNRTTTSFTPAQPAEPANKEVDDFVPNGWTDDPQGVSESLQYEWVCKRIKSSSIVNGEVEYLWSSWSEPKLFSHFGANGKDGNGFESIYYRTNNIDDNISTDRPFGDPNIDNSFQSPWTDEPQGVSESKKYEFIATRKKVNGVWTPYSLPSLWGKYAMDGSGFESIFKLHNSNSGLTTPVSSNIDNYIPNGWVGNPLSPTYENKYVFTCKRIKVNSVWNQWSEPTIFSYLAQDGIDGKDGKDVEFIFRLYFTQNLPPALNPLYKNEDEYHSPETGWTDDPSGVSYSMPYEYIAKRERINGVWGQWSTPKVWSKLGEDGEPGKDGKDFEWIYKNYTESTLPAIFFPSPSDNVDDFVPNGWTDNETQLDEVNKYVFYSKRQKVNGVWSGWAEPRLWSHFGSDGKDGKDIEFVYLTTATITKPVKPVVGVHYTVSEFQTDDFVPILPDLWSDDPVSLTEEKPYSWMMRRVKENNVWLDFNEPTLIGIPGPVGPDGADGAIGDTYIRRYAVNGSNTTPPVLTNNVLNPPNWGLKMPTVQPGFYLWMTEARVTSSNILKGTWSIPVRISPIDRGEDENLIAPSMAYRGTWNEGRVYSGNEYVVDVVVFNGKGYIARGDAGEIPKGVSPEADINKQYWNMFTEQPDSVFTDFLFSYSAYIQNLTVGGISTGEDGEARTVIGISPASQLDVTLNSDVFSLHGIRQYYESGRIALYMGQIKNYNYPKENGEHGIANGWAVINFKDEDGSPIRFILDNNLSDILVINSIPASWSTINYILLTEVTYNGSNYPAFDWQKYNREVTFSYISSQTSGGLVSSTRSVTSRPYIKNKNDSPFYLYKNGTEIIKEKYNGYHSSQEELETNWIKDGWYCEKMLTVYSNGRSRASGQNVISQKDRVTEILTEQGKDLSSNNPYNVCYTWVYLIIKGKIVSESIISPTQV